MRNGDCVGRKVPGAEGLDQEQGKRRVCRGQRGTGTVLRRVRCAAWICRVWEVEWILAVADFRAAFIAKNALGQADIHSTTFLKEP